MSKNCQELLKKSHKFNGDSKAIYVKFSPKVNSDGDVYLSPIENNEKPLSYYEIRKAVLKSRKI